jgi:hypothetical protein
MSTQQKNIDQQADDYAAEYLMTTEGNDYVPTDWERELIVDALHGFIAGYWPATSQDGGGEEKADWWNGFAADFLTDGKGQASTAVWSRCRAAFDNAWPSGKSAAVDAAIAVIAKPAGAA